MDPEKYEEVISSEEFKKDVLQELLDKATEYKLNGIERVKKVAFRAAPFSAEEGILTPTFKLKRAFCKQFFAKEIEAMYADHQEF